MGIEVGTINAPLEQRYRGLHVYKNMSSGSADIVIETDTGFYHDNGEWVGISSDSVNINGDAVWYLFGLSDEKLGKPNAPIGELIETAIYGILLGQIPTQAYLTVNATDAATLEPVQGRALVTRTATGDWAGDVNLWEPTRLDIIIGATIRVEADGYEPLTITKSVLAGHVVEDVMLTPIPVEEPEPEPPVTPEEPSEPSEPEDEVIEEQPE